MIHTSDTLPPKRKRETSFYIAFLVILPVYLVGPLAWIFLSWELSTRGFLMIGFRGATWWEKVLCYWAVVETAFSIYHYYLVRKLASRPARFAPPHVDHISKLFLRILQSGLADASPHQSPSPIADVTSGAQVESNIPRSNSPLEKITLLDKDDHRAIDFRTRMRTWFHHAPWSDITLSSLRKWLAWSVFSTHFEALTEEEKDNIDEKIAVMEMRAGMKIPQDVQGEKVVKPMRLTLDPLNVRMRPLVAYAVIGGVQVGLREIYRWKYGVTFGSFRGIEYALRLPQSSTPSNPILFLHGLGIGLPQYHQLLSNFLSHESLSSHPILVPLQPHISQTIWHRNHLNPLDREKTVENLKDLLLEVGFVKEGDRDRRDGLTVLSHSNGSMVHAWILRAYPQLIHRSCFVDPVTFCLWEGDVCYNFVYKPPTNAIELLMRYYVGTELGVANTIQRHFDWSANLLFIQEIPSFLNPRKTSFFLGGKDSIVDAHRVRKYLLAHGVKEGEGLSFDRNGAHGSALLSKGREIERIVRWLGLGDEEVERGGGQGKM